MRMLALVLAFLAGAGAWAMSHPSVPEPALPVVSFRDDVNYAHLALCEFEDERDWRTFEDEQAWQRCMRSNGIDPAPALWESVDVSF